MSIKFDGSSRIIDQFVDRVDSLSNSLAARLTVGLRTCAGGDSPVRHYALQDDVAKIAVISAETAQEGVQAPVERPVGINLAGVRRIQEVSGESVDVRIDEQRWDIPHKLSCSFVPPRTAEVKLRHNWPLFRHASIADRAQLGDMVG
jgi:hypothetical protein